MIPIISIAGKPCGGKTTLIGKIIAELTNRSYKVGVIKHNIHGFEIDYEGKGRRSNRGREEKAERDREGNEMKQGVRSQKIEKGVKRIRSWEDKKVIILNFSISQLLIFCLLLFTVVTGCGKKAPPKPLQETAWIR